MSTPKMTIPLDIGVTVCIEYLPGDVRFADTDHPVTMAEGVSYGYFANTVSLETDGTGDLEELDCYLGSDLTSKLIFRITQLKSDGSFDEFKFILGCASLLEAKNLYLAHMPKDLFGGIEESNVALIKTYNSFLDSVKRPSIRAFTDAANSNTDKPCPVPLEITAFVTQAEDVPNGNNVIYEVNSIRQRVKDAQPYIAQRQLFVWYVHAEPVYGPEGKQPDGGGVIGFKYHRLAVAVITALTFDEDTYEVWSKAEIFNQKHDDPELDNKLAIDIANALWFDNYFFSVSLRSLGPCDGTGTYTQQGKEINYCTSAFIEGWDILPPNQKPAKAGAAIKSRQAIQAQLDNTFNSLNIPSTQAKTQKSCCQSCSTGKQCDNHNKDQPHTDNMPDVLPRGNPIVESSIIQSTTIGANMIDSDRIKKKVMAMPSVSKDEFLAGILIDDSWMSAADLEAAVMIFDDTRAEQAEAEAGMSETTTSTSALTNTAQADVDTSKAATGVTNKTQDKGVKAAKPTVTTSLDKATHNNKEQAKNMASNKVKPAAKAQTDEASMMSMDAVPSGVLEVMIEQKLTLDQALAILEADGYTSDALEQVKTSYPALQTQKADNTTDVAKATEEVSKEDALSQEDAAKKPVSKLNNAATQSTGDKEASTMDKGTSKNVALTDATQINAALAAVGIDTTFMKAEQERLKGERRQKALMDSIENLFVGQEHLTDQDKQYLRTLEANEPGDIRLALVKHEIKTLATTRSNQAQVDSRINAMGGRAETMRGHSVDVKMGKPWKALCDKMNAVTEDIILHSNYQQSSGAAELERYKAQKAFIDNDPKFQDWENKFDAENYNALSAAAKALEIITRNMGQLDAITSADVGGVNYARNVSKLYQKAVFKESFYATTVINNVFQPLLPGVEFNRSGKGGGNTATPQKIGGVWLMPLEYVQESEAAQFRFNKPKRSAGAIDLISNRLEYNRFATRTRALAGILDKENYLELLSGDMGFDEVAGLTLQVAASNGRSIDNEAISELILTCREYNAVHVAVAETPGANEWIENTSTTKIYGNTVTWYMATLGPYAATTLDTSNPVPSTIYYHAPIVKPREKTYIDGNDNRTVDVILYKVEVTTPSGAPVLGFKNKAGDIADIYDGDGANYFIDDDAGRIAFGSGLGLDSTHKATAKYWYATNYYYWSKTKGLWNSTTATFQTFASGTTKSQLAEAYVQQMGEFAGTIGQNRQRYPDFVLGRFDFTNAYVGNARTFEKQVSPQDAVLYPGWAQGQVIGTTHNLIHVKTSNPNMPNSVVIGQMGAQFFGIGDIVGMQQGGVLIAPSGTNGGIVAPANADWFKWVQTDVLGTPQFSDGRNFPTLEVRILP